MPSRFFRRSRAVLTGVALCGAATAVLSTATSGAASATPVPSTGATASATASYITLYAVSSGLYLDIQGGSAAKGARVVQWTPTYTASEAWHLGLNGLIRNENSGMCLTTDGVEGDQLYQWPCRRSLANYQKWTQYAVNGGVLSMVNSFFNLYVDVYDNNTTLGGPIDAWPWNGGYSNQQFVWTPAAAGLKG